jgi:cyclic beta-1,2-glucan synthetase
LEVNKLRFTPCFPADWKSFQVHYRYRETVYHITVSQSDSGRASVTLDGVVQPDHSVTLVDDGQKHSVEVSELTASHSE